MGYYLSVIETLALLVPDMVHQRNGFSVEPVDRYLEVLPCGVLFSDVFRLRMICLNIY